MSLLRPTSTLVPSISPDEDKHFLSSRLKSEQEKHVLLWILKNDPESQFMHVFPLKNGVGCGHTFTMPYFPLSFYIFSYTSWVVKPPGVQLLPERSLI